MPRKKQPSRPFTMHTADEDGTVTAEPEDAQDLLAQVIARPESMMTALAAVLAIITKVGTQVEEREDQTATTKERDSVRNAVRFATQAIATLGSHMLQEHLHLNMNLRYSGDASWLADNPNVPPAEKRPKTKAPPLGEDDEEFALKDA